MSMKERGRFKFLFDGYIVLMVALGAAGNIALWYWLRHALSHSNGFVVLHFTAASGVDLIGEKGDLYLVPLWVALISVANLALARAVYAYDALAGYILVSAAPLLNMAAFGYLFLLVRMSG